MTTSQPTLIQLVKAWAVHAFTMTGMLWAVLSLLAFVDGHISLMWLWLGIALAVDAVDGTFARRARVREVIPWFDGVILDDIVDYLNWTFIPALFMYKCLPLGPQPLAMIILILVCVSSLFCYCNTGMKSSDYYFVGFPAAWNIVALYFYLLGTGAVFNVIVTVVISLLTLSTVTFLHPFRVKKFMIINLIATIWWVVNAAFLVALHPDAPIWVLALWGVPAAWFTVMGVWRTVKGRPLDTNDGD